MGEYLGDDGEYLGEEGEYWGEEGGREGGGLGVKKMRFDLLFQEKKSLPRYLYGYSVQNLPAKIS